MLHPSRTLLTEKSKFASTNQNLFRWMLGASRGIVSILMRICRCAGLAGMLRHGALIDRLLHQLRVSEGKITHLCKEDRENSQADPVDDAGKLESITDCRDKEKTTVVKVHAHHSSAIQYVWFWCSAVVCRERGAEQQHVCEFVRYHTGV